MISRYPFLHFEQGDDSVWLGVMEIKRIAVGLILVRMCGLVAYCSDLPQVIQDIAIPHSITFTAKVGVNDAGI
jgi:hypothetical protein